MRPYGRRTKKLVVAFHFQFANQASWKCDECRRNGLERQRGCPWIPDSRRTRRIVWARKEAVCQVCPKGAITAYSLRMLEEFGLWRLSGPRNLIDQPARTADAFLVLEQELRAENSDARQNS